jgi:tripartite-type tricarboxylate transporter receptor subunit TctC
MIEAVRAEPGKYSFGSSGPGSAGPIMFELLIEALDLDVKIVPYAGGGQTRTAIQGGHIDMTAGGNSGMVPVSDSTNMIGVFWKDRVAEWPGGMTVNEQIASLGVELPTAAAFRFHAVHREVKENYPERFDALVEAFRKTTLENEEFKAFADSVSVRREWHGPEESQAMIDEVDARFFKILQAGSQ